MESRHLQESVVSSIGAGKSVIAKRNKEYRVITGYDGTLLFEPDYRPAADVKTAISYDNIEYIYVFGDKAPPRYTFLDVLKSMEKVMDSDFSEGILFTFLHQFDYEGGKLWELNAGAIQKRFQRLRAVAGWIPNLGHGLQSAFRDRSLLASLGADVDRLGESLDTIGYQTHLLHGRGYMLSAICDSANALSVGKADKWPWNKHSLITSAWKFLDSIMDYDLRILWSIKKALRP